MELCSFILSLVIVGAYEGRPGIMQVQYLNNETVEEIYVYTEDYISCLEDGVSIQQPGSIDRGRDFTTSNP